MRRFLLCLLLLPFATPCFAQYPSTLQANDGNLYGVIDDVGESVFYSYNPATGQPTILNSTAPFDLYLCLERSDGTLLGIATGASASSWQAVDVTLAGVVTTIAQFPANSAPACPAIANDGNYYGTSSQGGDYSYGYIYQLTAAGKINVFFNFTGGADGVGSEYPPVQASDGNLYWFINTPTTLLQRYSPATGLTPTDLPYFNAGGPLIEAPDGNFYAPGGYGGSVIQITPTGAATAFYTPPSQDDGNEPGGVNNVFLTGSTSQPLAALLQYQYTNDNIGDDCPAASGNYFPMVSLSLAGAAGNMTQIIGVDENDPGIADADDYSIQSLLFGSGGAVYAEVLDQNEQETFNGFGVCSQAVTNSAYNATYNSATTFPVVMSLSKTHVKPGGSATLTWSVNNATSDTMQQCFGFGSLSGKVALTGSATMTAPSAGSYVTSIICGGTQTGIATLVAGNATLSLASSATQVNQGANVTLFATVTNPGTPLPTGKVNFMVGTTVVGSATLNNSMATQTASTATVPPGTYTITASYAGDSNYGPATSSPVSVTVVSNAPTSTALTPANQIVVEGANASITATVTGNAALSSPTGSVKFILGTTTIGTVTLKAENSTNSTATLTAPTTSIAPGNYTVTARYGGDSTHLASSSNSVTVIVNPTTPVALTISPNPVPASSSFTLTATITGKDNPSGTVAFYANGTQDLASGNVSGGVAKVTLPTGTLASGTYSITAYYAGDTNNPSGTSPAVSLTVQ
jgi:hypothetical protein